ncbi:MAG: hypothetical protein MUP80_15495 [Acidobacteriia bacterium]|nr:hypothetical protein [Terriglobia bacterium]
MRRLIVSVFLMLLVPLLLSAQEARESWDNLKKLVPGEGIRIVLKDAKSYRVTFESFDEGGIVVRTATGQQTYARDTVLRVSSKGQSHRLRNALIGAGIAGGISGAAVAANYSHDPESGTIAAVVGIPIATIAGAGVGALIPTGGWHDVYRAGTTPVPAPRR